jgi:peptidoglycan/LPS O-acetylase OafA/YrhL
MRLSFLDTLRGLAIIGVVAVHTTQSIPNQFDSVISLGRFGVQLFFLVSAYTMCMMWDYREGESGRVIKFYIRRMVRVAPLFWLAIPISLFFGLSVALYSDLPAVISTALFAHTFFPTSINAVVPGGWSIGVEVVFYVLFPLIYSVVKKNEYAALSGAIILSLVYGLYVSPFLEQILMNEYGPKLELGVTRDFLYLNFLNQIPAFMLGIYLYLYKNSLKEAKFYLFVMSWLVGAFFVYQNTGDIRDFLFVLVLLLLALFFFVAMRYNFNTPLMSSLGKESYGIYLSHFFVIELISESFELNTSLYTFLTTFIFTMVLSYILARALTLTIDRYFHNLANEKLLSRF